MSGLEAYFLINYLKYLQNNNNKSVNKSVSLRGFLCHIIF